MAKLEKRAILVVSTGHLTKETAEYLNDTPSAKWPFCGGPYADFGWFLYAHDENSDGSIPPDLYAVMQFAKANGCTNVLFDRDADQVEGLPFHEW